MDSLFSDHNRKYKELTYVYPVISRRSRGLSLGINLNIDKNCNFDCPYCQVDRTVPNPERFNLQAFQAEFLMILQEISQGYIWQTSPFDQLPPEKRIFSDIAIAGDGEPTTSPFLLDTMKYLLEVSENYALPEIVWISNATGLRKEQTLQALDILAHLKGTVWAKLDAGTQSYFETVSASNYKLDRIQKMIEELTPQVRLKIQSCFMKIEGSLPSADEISAYLDRLKFISAKRPITEVQIYTIARKPAQDFVSPLQLKEMQKLFQNISQLDLPVQFYSGAAD